MATNPKGTTAQATPIPGTTTTSPEFDADAAYAKLLASNAAKTDSNHVVLTVEQVKAIEAGQAAASARLCHVTQHIRLAAFASEARRTLTAIDDALAVRSALREVLHETVPAWNEWAEMDDVAGEVLKQAAADLVSISCEYDDSTHVLRAALSEVGE